MIQHSTPEPPLPPMKPLPRTGRNIRQLRVQAGLSQEALAKALNINRVSVSRWETDYYLPALDDAALVANYFGVTIDELLYARPELVFHLGRDRLLWRGRYWGLCGDEQIYTIRRES